MDPTSKNEASIVPDQERRTACKKRLSKQMSLQDRTREEEWARRRSEVWRRKSVLGSTDVPCSGDVEGVRSITDRDLEELKGFMDLGFRFSEEECGHVLCTTLPALDLYFAVNRQFSMSPVSSPTTATSAGASLLSVGTGSPSPRSPCQIAGSDAWNQLVQPGDSPEHVKTKLRLWAQTVAMCVKSGS